MATQTDLWGDLAPAEVRTPLSIMREQAALLGTKTQNLVEAVVSTVVVGEEFTHYFNLVVPALSNYAYQLFVVSHRIDLYPLTVRNPEFRQLENEHEFVEWLGRTLSSIETRKIISNLLAQVKS